MKCDGLVVVLMQLDCGLCVVVYLVEWYGQLVDYCVGFGLDVVLLGECFGCLFDQYVDVICDIVYVGIFCELEKWCQVFVVGQFIGCVGWVEYVWWDRWQVVGQIG